MINVLGDLIYQSVVARRVLRWFEPIGRLERLEASREAKLAGGKTDLNSVADKLCGALHAERSHHLILVAFDRARGKL